MAKVYDLTAKIDNERPIIKIGEKEFKVNDNHKTVILVQAELQKKSETEAFDFVFEKLLGEEAAKEIEKMDLSFSNVKTLFLAVMAAASGEELETIEARFQQATK